MTEQMRPIDLPSYELVQRLMHESGFMISDPDDEMVFPAPQYMKLASRLIRHGADQELEACCEWVEREIGHGRQWNAELRNARRPRLPSLKEQALSLVPEPGGIPMKRTYSPNELLILRRALEALPNV